MTPFPHSVSIDASIKEAREFMLEHRIHHLPVTDNNQLVGILSDRDIKLFLGPDLEYPSEFESKVRDVYLDHAYIVDLNERLDRVLLTMAERHIGSALVTRNGRLAGVFTSNDACKSYADHLHKQFGPFGGDEAA
jgi:CBS domain-containing protein